MEDVRLSTVEDAIKDFKEGKFVIVVDDEDRENEGDLIIAAEKIDADKVNSCSSMRVECFAHLLQSADVMNWISRIRFQRTPLCSVLLSR